MCSPLSQERRPMNAFLFYLLKLSYHLIWATELPLAAIGLVFPAIVLGYKLFNCSMYQVPVLTLIEQFVWLYFKQLLGCDFFQKYPATQIRIRIRRNSFLKMVSSVSFLLFWWFCWHPWRGKIWHHFEFNYILNLYIFSMCFVHYRNWIICTVFKAVPMLFFRNIERIKMCHCLLHHHRRRRVP